MHRTIVNLTQAEFEARFTFLPNRLNPNSSWPNAAGKGCLFKTIGNELTLVLLQDRRHIWTVIGNGEGPFRVCSGLFLDNCIGYLVCTEPVTEHITYQVRMDSATSEESAVLPHVTATPPRDRFTLGTADQPNPVTGVTSKKYSLQTLTQAEFEARFTFIPNHINPNASWPNAAGQGCVFKPFGKELAWVFMQDRETIWTVFDTGEGPFHIYSGLSQVDRLGYLICTERVPRHVIYQVCIGTDSNDFGPGASA